MSLFTMTAFSRLPGPQRGPLARLMLAITAAVLAVVFLFVGAFVFLIVVGVMAVATLILSVRIWWLRRSYRMRPTAQGEQTRNHVIEGEYTVVEKVRKREH